MASVNGRLSIFGNKLKHSHAKKAIKWQKIFTKKFNYNPDEKYTLSLQDNQYLGRIFGLKNIVRNGNGDKIDKEKGIICSTIRMGFGHYRIAMAGVSCAKAMGFTPYWLDLLAIPGITTDVINWCNKWYSYWSRKSQKSKFFNKYIWEPTTTGDPTLPLLSAYLNHYTYAWPWRHIKTNIKDFKMSELFKNLYQALPVDIPVITAHMWNCMGAVAGGMTNVVNMMFDNWPMAFQLTNGAKHAVQSPSGYYGFRVMNGFGDKKQIMNPMPPEAIRYVGHHVDHELVENIEVDCNARVNRMDNNEARRIMVTMGGAGAQANLFKAVIEHCIPLIKQDKVCLFVNLGDHKNNWEWLQKELKGQQDLINTHFTWEETKAFADNIRDRTCKGLHIFLHDNIFHAVYATNYLMRVVDIMITKPSELAFYPIPKIFNKRVGGHEKWGAIRSAEIGDGTIEVDTIPKTLQALDVMTHDKDLMKLYCDCIIKNKSIGIYDGAYKSVAWATGKKWERKLKK